MPTDLEHIVNSVQYRPGWKFWLELVGKEVRLQILCVGFDSYHPHRGPTYATSHSFRLPEISPPSWKLWLFERIMEVEKHEAMEFFQVGDERPFAPMHSRSANSYYQLPHERI